MISASPLLDLLSGCGVISGEGSNREVPARGVTNGLSISGLDVVEGQQEPFGRFGVHVLVVIVVVLVVTFVVVVTVVVMSCALARDGVWRPGVLVDGFGLPKSSFLAGLSAFDGVERGCFDDRYGMPSLSSTRRFEGLRTRPGLSGRFLAVVVKSFRLSSDRGCLDIWNRWNIDE